MNARKLSKVSCVLFLILVSATIAPLSSAIDANLSPPPTPAYILTVPRINEITYMIRVRNINASWVTIDLALPKTWLPDTYVKIIEIKKEHVSSILNYTDRENQRMRTYSSDLKPDDSIVINVTFYSLKYKLDYATHQPMVALGYPNGYFMYTQPENYIESNDSLIVNKALALVGNRTNPFRIAEQMYDFALSYITYRPQQEIRGALWALQNGTGDCTEFGTLFVALMRAVGIPARTALGHVARELSSGGIANATKGWVDSPHLWAEFYVEGFGWVPVDPTFGRKDPEKHFGKTWADYLPLMKGPTMNDPTDSLVNIRYSADTKIETVSELMVTTLSSLPFGDQAIQDFVAANDRSNKARAAAFKAYNYAFNITEAYPLLENAYASLVNATRAMSEENSSLSSEYSNSASSSSNQTLRMISSIVMNEAGLSINRAWKEMRFLGALSGEYYLRMAQVSQSNDDYLSVVQNAYFARSAADQAPSFFVFVGPVLLCVFTVAMIRRRNNSAKHAGQPETKTAR